MSGKGPLLSTAGSGAAVSAPPRASRTSRLSALRRALINNPPMLVAACAILILVLLAIFGSWIAPYGVDEFTDGVLVGPSLGHPFGIDQLGRDVFSRVILGAHISLSVALEAVGGAFLVGVPLGLFSGYIGGITDKVIMRCMDVVLTLPYILLAVLIAASLGPSLQSGIIAIGIVRIPRFARVTRASTMAVSQLLFVEAARSVGASHLRIIWREILPNMVGPLIVYSTLSLGDSILAAAVLSYLGLGAQPPTPEWGAMLQETQRYLTTVPFLSFFPGLFVFIAVLSFNVLGDGLRDYLDPKTK